MKRALQILTLVAIVGVIWYFEAGKVQPSPAVNGGAPQSVAVAPASGEPNSATTGMSAAQAIAAIAAADKRSGYPPAVEIVNPAGFVNVPSLKIADLAGKKVVLVDFWTYSCINCIRAIPYLNAWYKKYHDQGLEIVGVHTPEFEFEKNYDNVKAAVAKFDIKYPVVLDNNYGTWTAYHNAYWPHEYLIDLAGYVVHDHIGEGEYDVTEAEIRKLLMQRAEALGSQPTSTIASGTVKPTELSGIGSPETYFGAMRNEFLANGTRGVEGTQTFTEPQNIQLNKLYLAGKWNISKEYATIAEAGAKVIYKYHSTRIFFVATAPTGATIRVLQDGKSVSGTIAGNDVKDGKLTVKEARLYTLVNNPSSEEHTLELIIDTPGLQAFTFTFG